MNLNNLQLLIIKQAIEQFYENTSKESVNYTLNQLYFAWLESNRNEDATSIERSNLYLDYHNIVELLNRIFEVQNINTSNN